MFQAILAPRAPCSVRGAGHPSAAGRNAGIERLETRRRAPAPAGYTSLSSSPARKHQRRRGFRAHAHPVDRRLGAGCVPFVSIATRKPRSCSASTARRVELQRGFAARAHHEGDPRALTRRPRASTAAASSRGIRELAAVGAVGADEVGVAEIADGARAILPRAPSTDCSPRIGRNTAACPRARPRLAACRRSPSRCTSWSRRTGSGRSRPACSNPRRRSRHASQRPQRRRRRAGRNSCA